MTRHDLPGLRGRGRRRRLRLFPPFLDARPFVGGQRVRPAGGRADPAARGRDDARRTSSCCPIACWPRLCAQLGDLPWRLVLVGDGEARAEVEAMFAPFGERVALARRVPIRRRWPRSTPRPISMSGPPATKPTAWPCSKRRRRACRWSRGGRAASPTSWTTADRPAGRAALTRRPSPPRSARSWSTPRGAAPWARRRRPGSWSGTTWRRLAARLAAALAEHPGAGMRVCLIRHASTGWNEAGRIQGRTDVPLSAAGRAQAAVLAAAARLRRRRLPDQPAGTGARDRRRCSGFADPPADAPAGRDGLGQLRGPHAGGAAGRARPGCASWRRPGSISARPAARARGWWPRGSRPACASSPRPGRDHVLVTHKGVLRASLVLALGWDMLGKPPVRYEPERALIHELGADGRARVRGRAAAGRRSRDGTWRCLFWVQSLWAPATCGGPCCWPRRSRPVAPRSPWSMAARRALAAASGRAAGPVAADHRQGRRLRRSGRRSRASPFDDGAAHRAATAPPQPPGHAAAGHRHRDVPVRPARASRRAAAAAGCSARACAAARSCSPACATSWSASRDPGRYRWMVETCLAHYDRVLVHGDARLLPFSASFPPAAELGDAHRPHRLRPSRAAVDRWRQAPAVLVSAGGGAVGERLLRAALAAPAALALRDAPWLLVGGQTCRPTPSRLWPALPAAARSSATGRIWRP